MNWRKASYSNGDARTILSVPAAAWQQFTGSPR